MTNARLRGVWTGLAALAVLVTMISPRALAAEDVLVNGDFSSGDGAWPDHWYARVNLPTTDYVWTPPSNGEPGQVGITSYRPNDGRWVQPLRLRPGWYYISAEITTSGVWTDATGAFIGLTDEGVRSKDLRGDNAWNRMGFYLEAGSNGAYVEVVLRLGEFSDFTEGRAFFRGASVVPVDAPVQGEPAFQLDEVRRFQDGSPWTLAMLFALLIGACAISWQIVGKAGLGDR